MSNWKDEFQERMRGISQQESCAAFMIKDGKNDEAKVYCNNYTSLLSELEQFIETQIKEAERRVLEEVFSERHSLNGLEGVYNSFCNVYDAVERKLKELNQ